MSEGDNLFGGGFDGLSNVVVFDLETTGLSPSNDEIIQIAAVKIGGGKVLANDSFFSYVRPTRRISSFITDLTGITDDDVEDAPPSLDALKQFAAFCGDSLLVAHNGHAFDIPFIRSSTRCTCRGWSGGARQACHTPSTRCCPDSAWERGASGDTTHAAT